MLFLEKKCTPNPMNERMRTVHQCTACATPAVGRSTVALSDRALSLLLVLVRREGCAVSARSARCAGGRSEPRVWSADTSTAECGSTTRHCTGAREEVLPPGNEGWSTACGCPVMEACDSLMQ